MAAHDRHRRDFLLDGAHRFIRAFMHRLNGSEARWRATGSVSDTTAKDYARKRLNVKLTVRSVAGISVSAWAGLLAPVPVMNRGLHYYVFSDDITDPIKEVPRDPSSSASCRPAVGIPAAGG